MAELLLVALAVLCFALVSQKLALSPITAPMVFTGIGIAVGPAGLGVFDLQLRGEAVSILVEATLVLVLFTDAIRIDLRALRREAGIPGRLLGVGMPLTILAGTAAAYVIVPGLGLAEAALLAAVLAPTDAALGQAVVSDRRLPARIRQALNVESGLNDGVAVPVVTVLLAVVVAEEVGGTADWISFAASQVGWGLAAGLLAGSAGGLLLDRRVRAGAVEGVYRQLGALSLAASAYAGAELVGGNGFIAAFLAGLTFGQVAQSAHEGVPDFTEDEGELLTDITFLVFGAVLVGPVLGDLTWRDAAYAIVSLTAVRALPVLLAMAGTRTLRETRLFLAWFGPRGLASILFAVLVADELDSPTGERIFTVACCTVLASVVLHGLTAAPWAGRLSARIAAAGAPLPETRPAPELPTRRRLHPAPRHRPTPREP